jgi:mortality factor 4-like protein 1
MKIYFLFLKKKTKLENYQIKSEITIRLTEELKQILIEDFHMIQQNKIASLPATIDIKTMLDEYIDFKVDNQQFDRSSISELVEGLKDYFNIVLPTKLLYKFERVQYNEVNIN